MENQQPIKQKGLTLLEFKERTAKGRGYSSWQRYLHGFNSKQIDYNEGAIIDDYISYREQQAKHAAWEECSQSHYDAWIAGELIRVGLGITGDRIYDFDSPASPYEPREKGGEVGNSM